MYAVGAHTIREASSFLKLHTHLVLLRLCTGYTLHSLYNIHKTRMYVILFSEYIPAAKHFVKRSQEMAQVKCIQKLPCNYMYMYNIIFVHVHVHVKVVKAVKEVRVVTMVREVAKGSNSGKGRKGNKSGESE